MKFSIVTPVYNGAKFIRETIESILSQEGDFHIEYIIMDGGSTDGTVEIIKSYDEKIRSGAYQVKCAGIDFKWHSEKDGGMYDAINKGFAVATGDIYAYINSDDIYLRRTFEKIMRTFNKFPQILWLKGTTSFMKSDGKVYQRGKCFIYDQKWIRMGVYGRNAYFIHQDSVFWKRELWEKSGGADNKFRLAGDYYLWIQFSKYAPLWSINSEVSMFRKTNGQLSGNMLPYRREQEEISEEKGFLNLKIKTFFWARSKIPAGISNIFFSTLYRLFFPGINLYYIEIDSKNEMKIKKASSYTV